jgi:glycosyltransferase involved in cell wall biosynthesis
MPSSILFVHQGYELYGSDRTLIQSVQAVVARWPEASITVVLPRDGDLRAALLRFVSDVRVVNIAVLRKSNLKRMKLRDVGRFIARIREARRMMRSYDVIYINTIMVMDYMIAAALTRRPRLVHVHEMPTGTASIFFSVLLALSRAFLIFNSHATESSFNLLPWQQRTVVWNGVAAVAEVPPRNNDSRRHFLLIGRFNSWKGQEILLRAVAQLPHALRNRLRVRLVGSVFGDQSHFVETLVRIIEEEGLAEMVEICPFAPDPWVHYKWADVIVVPSTRPEPFGLVAIEAMAAGRAVIAANHGGLAEIVIDDVTGTLIAPGSLDELAAAVQGYIENPARAVSEGDAGRLRFCTEFEEGHYKLNIADIIARMSN